MAVEGEGVEVAVEGEVVPKEEETQLTASTDQTATVGHKVAAIEEPIDEGGVGTVAPPWAPPWNEQRGPNPYQPSGSGLTYREETQPTASTGQTTTVGHKVAAIEEQIDEGGVGTVAPPWAPPWNEQRGPNPYQPIGGGKPRKSRKGGKKKSKKRKSKKKNRK